MSFANAIKEIYESQKGALSESVDYCEIAPEFDADHWESKLNSVAEAKAKFQASYPGIGYKHVSAYKSR